MKIVRALVLFAACRCDSEAHTNVPRETPNTSVAATKASSSEGPRSEATAVIAAGEAFSVSRFLFPLSTTRLSIVDVAMKNDLRRVLEESRGDLVTNGGFFGTKNEPIGLARSAGKELSSFSKTMSGGVLFVQDGRATLLATEDFEKQNLSPDFAIQCRPRLVVDGKLNIRSDDGKRSERTALCIRDSGKTLELFIARNEITGPSLYALGNHLASEGCEAALNLDGGPSTGVAFRQKDAVVDESPLGPIRHAVVFQSQR